MTVALTGFATVNREVDRHHRARTSNLTFGMKVATVEETVTVTAETPVVDTKKMRHRDHAHQGGAVAGPELARPLGACCAPSPACSWTA